MLSLQSGEDSFHFPFPSRGEPEVARHLPGDGDGFRGLAARGTAVHEQQFVGGWGYFFFLIGGSKTLICSVATSIMIRSSCTCMSMQPCLFTELAF